MQYASLCVTFNKYRSLKNNASMSALRLKVFLNVGPHRFFRIEQRKHSSTHYVFLAAACKRSN